MRLIPAVVACAVIALPMSALAGPSLSELVDSAFSDLRSTSSPEDQRKSSENQRGYLYGGSYKLRIPSATMAPMVSVTAPKLKAGCNGIDANFGALTFLDGEDLKILLRKSVAQGTTYAFSLAMNAICGTCLSSMQKLADKVNAMTAGLMDSCENGKFLARMAGKGVSGMGDTVTDITTSMGYQKSGIGDSLFGGDKTWVSKTLSGYANDDEFLPPLSLGMLDTDPYKGQRDKSTAELMEIITQNPALAEKISNNLVYTMVYKKKMAYWFSSDGNNPTDQQLNDDAALLMGLLGSSVIYPVIDEANPKNNTIASRTIVGDQWREFFNGNPITTYDCSQVDGTQPDAKKIADSDISDILTKNCLFPTKKTLTETPIKKEIASYTAYVEAARLGLTNRSTTGVSAEHRAYMQHDPLQTIAVLRGAGPLIDNVAQAMKVEAADLGVKGAYIDWAEKVLFEMHGTIHGLLSKKDTAAMEKYIEDAKEKLAKVREEYLAERSRIMNKVTSIDKILEEQNAAASLTRLFEMGLQLVYPGES